MLDGIVVLLYKKDDRSLPSNYRPITLLNSMYKLFQKIIKNKIYEFVREHVTEDQ